MLFFLFACWAKNQDTADVTPDGSECGERDTEVIIGSGEFEWEDLYPNDEVVMVHGPQGG
jgi:hypothetical protein